MTALDRDALPAPTASLFLAELSCLLLPLAGGAFLLPLLAAWLWRTYLRRPAPPLPQAVLCLAVCLGWLAAWCWRPGQDSMRAWFDLAILGPALALGVGQMPPERLQKALLLGSLAAAGIALAQWLCGLTDPESWGSQDWALGRAYGTLGNPNVLAAYLAAATPMALAVAWPRQVKLGALALLLAACADTGSRGGWLGVFAASCLYVFRQKPGSAPLVPALLLAALLLPWPVSRRFAAVFGGGDATAHARLAIWRRGLEAFWARPIAGWGTSAAVIAPHPHNLLLEVLLQGGLFALAGYLPLAIWAGRAVCRGRPTASQTAAAASLAALLSYGLGDAVFSQPILYGLFWLNLGLIARKGRVYGEF